MKRALPYHERITDATFRRAVDFIDSGDAAGLAQLLQQNPELVRQRVAFEGENYFQNPSLLEFIAENPVRYGRLPANILEITRTLLAAKPTIPSNSDDPLSEYTSHACATFCIQVPISEMSWPLKKSWKLRCRSERNISSRRERGSGVVSSGGAGSAPSVSTIGILLF